MRHPHKKLEKIYKKMAHCLNKIKTHQNESTVCYCTTYIQKPWSQGRLVSPGGKQKRIKLRLQASVCEWK